MSIVIHRATADDARAIAEVRTAAAAHLTATHGGGHWSTHASEAAVRDALHTGIILVARSAATVVGTLRLQSCCPRAIDIMRFTPVRQPLYAVDVAVHPDRQRQGIGRRLLTEAAEVARAWPGNSIRLHVYDDPAGAGGFYRACHYREVAHVTYHDVRLLYFELLLQPPRASRRRTVHND